MSEAKKTIPVIISAVIALSLILTYRLWEPIELKAYDLRLRLIEYMGLQRGSATGSVVVVGMEEDSMIKEKPLIFWYPDIGGFLGRMKDYGASTVGIDLIPVHSLGDKIKDAVYSSLTSMHDARYEEFLSSIGEQMDNSLMGPIISASHTTSIIQAVAGGSVPYYYSSMAFMGNVRPADASVTSDKDHILRRQRLLNEDKKASFAYAIYNSIGGKDIGQENIILNYSLRQGIPYYSFKDVMNSQSGRDKFLKKAVILGYITKYEDVHSTPLGNRMPGSLIQAITVETLLSKTFLKSLPFSLEAVIIILLTGAGLAMSSRLRPGTALSGTALLIAGFCALNLVLFYLGYLGAVLPHMLCPLIVLTFVYPYKYFVEERQRKKVYRMFGYYMDKKIIDSLIDKDPESLLKGEYKDICILFLDIRDFTRMSGQAEAENIVGLLNAYFGKITAIIQRHQGFVNKFIGDGMLAFFSTGQNPVADALRAGDEIVKETEKMNDKGQVASYIRDWRLNIGIGIHWGRVVMGNIGSEKKMDFTIIGEPVNIASRVEGLTKQLKKNILLSAEAYEMAKEGFDFEFMGQFSVKGVEEPLSMYTVL